jgi:tryptophan 2,3-dioxygenase
LPADAGVEEMMEHIYWKDGATELSSGKKTLTLRQFEEKYMATFIQTARDKRERNLWAIFVRRYAEAPNRKEIEQAMRLFDLLVNVNWPLAHYRSAVRYLQQDPEVISATGGTNWQQYLPPRFQLRIFYPELWEQDELQRWGKGVAKTDA